MNRDRRLALLILKKIDKDASWSNLALNGFIRSEGADDPPFVRELVYETVRNRSLLDWNIDRFLQKPRIGLTEREILRLGFCQLALLGGVAEHAAVSETVALAGAFVPGKKGFVNAVMRNFQRSGAKLIFSDPGRDFLKYLCIRYSADRSIAELWCRSYGRKKAEELLRISNTVPPFAVRLNPLKPESAGLDGRALSIESEEFRKGLFSVQDGASQHAVRVLDPKPGEFVLDLCAAPGGKSCAAAELMQNRGRIIAFDIYEKRVGLIKKEAERLGIDIIEARTGDSSEPCAKLRGAADAVIADVPCSGLGVLRRRPEIKYRDARAAEEALIPIQKKIIRSAAYAAKPGGRLLYSTCTINPNENSNITSDFLNLHPEFEKISEEQLFPEEGGSDGFYICLMRRKC